MGISAQEVKKLRDMTAAPMMDCKRALQEADGDMEKARLVLRERGLAKAKKKGSRAAAEGIICSYIHGNDKLGVMVEMRCETDFVARNEEFQNLGREIAMQVAAMDPQYVAPEDVPEEIVEAERSIYRKDAADKPENIQEQIIEGKLGKFYEQVCLLKQPYVRDDDRTVEEIITDAIGKIGENIMVQRFVRMEVGGEDEE
jgi:elongation factor Ts